MCKKLYSYIEVIKWDNNQVVQRIKATGKDATILERCAKINSVLISGIAHCSTKMSAIELEVFNLKN